MAAHRRHGRGRIIPAYAGSTEANSLDGQTMADHPRIRGEHLAGLGRVIGGVGSSPHTRGALTPVSRCLGVLRIIPAYAGSTCEDSWKCQATADHPRIRGEHIYTNLKVPEQAGSSPHTRGAPSTTST